MAHGHSPREGELPPETSVGGYLLIDPLRDAGGEGRRPSRGEVDVALDHLERVGDPPVVRLTITEMP